MTARLGRVNRYNLGTLRESPAAEISGALGDLGTLLPLMIALAIHGSIDLPTTLVFTGVFNVITGAVFGIPLPVQPMKAIAAAAISQKSSLAETTAAGGWVGFAILLLNMTGLIRWLTAAIPVPIVKGIQLGAGLQLIISAGSSLILPLEWLFPLLDNRTWALLSFLALLFVAPSGLDVKKPRPFALLLFIFGICFSLLSIGMMESGHGAPSLPFLSIWRPKINIPAFMSPASIGMALSQLPLTTLNSIIAVCALGEHLFPPPAPAILPAPVSASPASAVSPSSPSPSPPSTTTLGISVSLMNLLACFFGCMPVCHGSGGLAAQYRFGARSGASIILLGLFKIALGVLLGNSLIDLLGFFPRGFLGVMVLAAGLELARAGGVGLNDGAPDLFLSEREEEEEGQTAEDDYDDGESGNSDDGNSDTRGLGIIHSTSANDRTWRGEQTRQGRDHNMATRTGFKQQGPRQRIVSEDERNERWTVMLMTAGGILAFKNDAIGFVAGLLCHWAYRFATAGSDSANCGNWECEDEESAMGINTSTATPGPGLHRRRRVSHSAGPAGRRSYLSGRRRTRLRKTRSQSRTQTRTEESPLLGSD
ncbi:putative sulfate transporter [Rhypophila decipiens]|uniref:Sulfate transporter n=1 Tax=Rhypophila decipiens TaxID=261697 RepID=A0AAN6YJP2_9PEZI|nr:putative sulfate transporter [Rhypophila decipiens]